MMHSNRLPVFVALIGPIQFWIILILAGLIRPEYDPLRQSISDLAVGPDGWLQRGNLIVFGLLELPFVALVAHTNRDVPGFRPSWLLWMASLGCILLGVFPAYVQQPAPVAAVHIASFGLVVASLISCCFLLPGPSCSRISKGIFGVTSRAMGLGSLAVLTVLLIHVGWSTFVGPTPLVPWAGLLERIVLALLTLWLELFVLTFALREHERPALEPSG